LYIYIYICIIEKFIIMKEEFIYIFFPLKYLRVFSVATSIPGVAGDFSVASDNSMCPGDDSASKNEYQVNPGGKGGRCVRLTTYHLPVPMSRNLGGLTSRNPVGLFRPVMGQLHCCYDYIFPDDLS
jgi:hypothetical protein